MKKICGLFITVMIAFTVSCSFRSNEGSSISNDYSFQSNHQTNSVSSLSDIVYNEEITIHARPVDGEYDSDNQQTIVYKTNIGCDISDLTIPEKHAWDSHALITRYIYIDKEETTLVKASQLKRYDGSFHDLYVVQYYYDLGPNNEEKCLNPLVDYDGEYKNYKGDTLVIENGRISGNYGDITFSTGEIKVNLPYECTIEEMSFNIDGTIVTQETHPELLNYSGLSLPTYLGFKQIDDGSFKMISDITRIGVQFFYPMEAYELLKGKSLGPISDFYYIRNNNFSIVYD